MTLSGVGPTSVGRRLLLAHGERNFDDDNHLHRDWMPAVSHNHIPRIEPMLEGLVKASEATARAARKQYRQVTRRRNGAALKPGPGTPLWNELARACAANLNRYGEKARLARLLGISRQRLHMLLVSRTACADAERTLQLMVWLQTRQGGSDPV